MVAVIVLVKQFFKALEIVVVKIHDPEITKDWKVFSWQNSSSLGDVIPAYEMKLKVSDEFSKNILETEVFYWTSFRQFKRT